MATEQQLQKSFEEGVRSITDAVRIGALRDAIARNDYAAVLRAVDIDDAAFDTFRRLMVETYAEGGISEVTGMPVSYRVRWNSATAEAESFARNFVGQQITYITNDARSAVQQTVADGLAFGRSTNRIALDIAGRVGADGKRRGGIVGLNQPQARWVNGGFDKSGKWVDGMRQKLSSDPLSVLRDYSKRDKRFDKLIAGAVDKPLTQAQIDRITGQYSERLLLVRGLMIARTERSAAINMGRQEAWSQAANRLGLPRSAVWKEWRHSNRQMEPRIAHVAANGTRVQGLDGMFNINGHYCLHPHDSTLPADEVINCECQVKYFIPRGAAQWLK